MKRFRLTQTRVLQIPTRPSNFRLGLLAMFLLVFQFSMNANILETDSDFFTNCNSISFNEYDTEAPTCGNNDGSISFTVNNPNNYCLIYRLYNYDTGAWQTGYQTSKTFTGLSAAEYRVKMYVDHNCDVTSPSTACYTPSSYLTLTCSSSTTCTAEFEHVDGVNESACNANDGKIITDPYINMGTALPYTVKYTYNSQVHTAGPYSENKDNYITGLAPGVYSNITLIDANDCEHVYGSNITIAEYTNGCASSSDESICTLTDHGTADHHSETRLLWLDFDADGIKEYAVVGTSTLVETSATTALITGTAVQVDNSCNVWNYSVRLKNKSTWAEWSDLGRSYKGNSYAAYDHTTWTYYEVDNSNSTFTGDDCLAGKTLNITFDSDSGDGFGFQIGNSANLKDADYGLSGWFNFSGSYTGHGDYNGDLTCGTGTNTNCDEVAIVEYDMDACYSYSSDNTNYDYSEFDAAYPDNGSFLSVTATNVFRNSGAHSCIVGHDGSGKAACFGVDGLNSFVDDSNKAIRFEVTLNPNDAGKLTGLQFYEWAPDTYSHISGNSGTNNHPTKYGIRVTKDGNEIYKAIDIATTDEWTLESFDFSNDPDFMITATTTFKFELLSYDAIGNGGSISAWDIDDIKILGTSCQEPGTGSIGSFVFEDKNGNGLQDDDETGIDDVTVMLLDTGGIMVGDAQTTTNGGQYLFSDLVAGEYKVKFTAPTGLEFTIANQGGDDTKDSDAVPMDGTDNGMSEVITLAEGGENLTIDAGLYEPAAIGNFIWVDANLNGIQDFGEAVLAGVPVELRDGDGNSLGLSTTTNENGIYGFSDLAPGDYKVIFPAQVTVSDVNYAITAADKGTNDAADSDAVAMAMVNEAMSQVVTLESGDDNDTVDAGYFASASVGNKVFEDVNRNGLDDSADNVFQNVTVMLVGTDVFGNDVNLTDITDDRGEYLFDNLTPGTYYVKFTAPFGYILTEKDAQTNTLDTIDSDADPVTGKTDEFTLANGDENLTIDAGLFFDPSLPVALTSFEAQLVNNSEVILKWATASEENNSHFVVERSVDGKDYRAVGVVQGNGTTNNINTYSLIDNDPYYGYNYYRLKQVDFDGKYEFSNVETVIISNNNLADVIIYPNPVVTTTTLRVVTPFETDAQVEVVDHTGKILMSIVMQKGANSKQLDLSELAPGMYFAYVNYNGHRELVHKIVKVEE